MTDSLQAWFSTAIRIPANSTRKIHEIQLQCCIHAGITIEDMLGPRRFADMVRARRIAMYLVRINLGKSWCEIGRRFGDRDHATVILSVRTIAAKMASDEGLAREIAVLQEKIKEGLANL